VSRCISRNLKFCSKLTRNYIWIYVDLLHPSENIKV